MLGRKSLFLFLAGMLLLAGCGSAGVGTVTDKAHDFTLQNINNRTVRLSDFENKIIILNFFATWCPPCRAEIPDFVELVNEHDSKDLVIIGVSLDRGGVDTVKEFAEKYKINYPLLLDDGLVSKEYGPIRSIPTTFIIDRKKNITEKIIGSRSKNYFEGAIKPLL